MNKMRNVVSGLLFGIVFGTGIARGEPPAGIYLEGKSDAGVILLHGHLGKPDGDVVGPLMRMMNESLGYHALSLRLPEVGIKERSAKLVEAYAAIYPEVEKLIEAGVQYLADEKQAKALYLVGFSMGTRMTTAYLAKHPTAPIRGFVGVSITCSGPDPMDSNANLSKVGLPVLDVYGTTAQFDLGCAEERKSMAEMLAKYKMVRVEGAPHNFRGYEDQLTNLVADWLKGRESVAK